MIISKNNDKLRDYQVEYKNEIYTLWKSHRSVMLQMPTGTGKTRLFASIVRDIHDFSVSNRKALKVLILVHREELVLQASETLGQIYNVAHGIIMADALNQNFFPTQIASVQTLYRRLQNWKAKAFDFIIIDEAHHALADTYRHICNTFRDAKILGVTATPYRLSGQSFKSMFDELVVSKRVSAFIEEGYLSRYDYYSISPTSEIQKAIDNISTFDIDGDYAISAMSKELDNNIIQSKLIKSYKKYAEGKKGIVYTINKSHNKHVCKAYKDAGYESRAIDSDTSHLERANVIKQFKNGKIQILCNVNIFSEGFDCPDVEFIQLARPTKSLSLFLQQVGRGLRIFPGLERVIFLDNVGSYNKFGLPSSYRNWRKYFYGSIQNVLPDIEKKSSGHFNVLDIETGNQVFIEGDKPVELIYTTINKNDKSLKTYDLNDFDDFEEFYIPEEISIESDFTKIYYYFDYDDWVSKRIEEWEIELFEYDIDDENINEDILFERVPYPLVKNLHKVKINGKWGLYDKNSKMIILSPEYDNIEKCKSLGKCIIIKDEVCGLYCLHQKKIIIPCSENYESIDFIKSKYRLNEYIVSKNNYKGVVNELSNTVIPIEYDEILPFNPDYYITQEINLFARKNKFWIIINIENKIKDFWFKKNKLGNYFTSTYKGSIGVVDEQGKILIPPIYKSLIEEDNFIIGKLTNGDYGVLNKEFKIMINFEYSEIKSIGSDYFIARKNYKSGLISLNGKVVLDFKYIALIIRDGVICVNYESYWRVIDINKKEFDQAKKLNEALDLFKKRPIYIEGRYKGLKLNLSEAININKKTKKKKSKKKDKIPKDINLTNVVIPEPEINLKDNSPGTTEKTKEVELNENKDQIGSKKVTNALNKKGAKISGKKDNQKSFDMIMNAYFKANKEKGSKKKPKPLKEKKDEESKTPNVLPELIPELKEFKKKRPRITIKKD